jgi:hypothetical protein
VKQHDKGMCKEWKKERLKECAWLSDLPLCGIDAAFEVAMVLLSGTRAGICRTTDGAPGDVSVIR